MNWLWDWFRWLNDAHGVNLPVFYDSFDRARFFRGVVTTIELSAVSVVASVVIGLIGVMFQKSDLKITRRIVQGYIQFFRNTPPLVQMYFFFFALGPLLPTIQGDYGVPRPMLGSFAWAAISLSFFCGAFNVEIFRSGIEAVPRTMVEAAEALGYTRLQTYRYVILPLAYRVCLPQLTSNLINLVKTTTIAYAIAVPETLFVANQIWSDALNVTEMMVLLLIFYNVLVGILAYLMNRWERALRLPGFGT